MIYLFLILLSIPIAFIAWRERKPTHTYLKDSEYTYIQTKKSVEGGIDFDALFERTWWQSTGDMIRTVYKRLGKYAPLKIAGLILLLMVFSIEFNRRFIRGNAYIVTVVFVVIGLVLGYLYFKKKEVQAFNQSFPDALNMLSSAVSSGESLVHAIRYVGDTMVGPVGREFKAMSERLQLGENPDDVFAKSCRRFPYKNFYFFIITLRANMNQGGQLKEIMSRLNRLMFNARTIEKKKLALTSEARASAKIVGAIPFIFLIMLQFLSPENYDFVMFNDDGRPVLYYVIISELIGLSIIKLLMKGIK